jgi:CheY-like chemotaxis protein
MPNTRRIYVAEDTPEDALILEAVLQRPGGRQLRFFSDGLALYRAVRQDPPDLLVLDLILPSLGGLALARLLKLHDHYRHIPILISSSITDPDLRERVTRAGADAFVPKPCDPQQMEREVARLLEGADGG